MSANTNAHTGCAHGAALALQQCVVSLQRARTHEHTHTYKLTRAYAHTYTCTHTHTHTHTCRPPPVPPQRSRALSGCHAALWSQSIATCNGLQSFSVWHACSFATLADPLAVVFPFLTLVISCRLCSTLCAFHNVRCSVCLLCFSCVCVRVFWVGQALSHTV